MSNSIKRMFLAIAALVISVAASAQVTTSAISGKITDKDGAVAAVPVVATHVPSGTIYYSITDATGTYRINNITPGGPYTVVVEMLGYRKVEYTGIYADLNQTMNINTVLEEEALNLDAAVFVADGKNSNMNVSRSGAGTSINQKTMGNLPSVSRSLNDMMKMTPQASTNGGGFSVGGGNYRGSSVTVDGAAFNNAFGIGGNLPAGGSPISIDALEQISVNITPFDVRQSGFTGGAINAVTKAGTNDVHASVYNYYNSNKLEGKKVAGEDLTQTETLNNTIGMTVGGPIIKNKLFFFVNAEYTLDSTPGSRYTVSTDGTIGATTNRPTAAKLDEMKKFLADNFNGYNPGRYQGYSLDTPDYKILARLDWNINATNKLNVRFSNTHTYGSNPPSSSMSPVGGTSTSFKASDGNTYAFDRYAAGRQSQYALYFESARYYQEQNFLSAAAELNSRLFDGRANNMLRLTWSHQYEPRSYEGDFFPTVDILEPYIDDKGAKQYAMYTTFGVDPFTYGNLRDVTTYIATDEFTYSTGIHNLIGGMQYEWNRAINGFMQGGAGWYIYESWDAFKNDVLNPGSAAGPNLFMITHANLKDATQQAFPTFDYGQFSVYAQDEMNISNNFKLTAGLRLEMPSMSFPYNNYNKAFADIAAANPNTSLAGLSTDQVMSNRLAVSPRIGFNWDVLGNRNLVVRGGSGIYTGRIPFVWLVSAIGNSNVMQYQYINKSAMGSGIHFSNDRNEIINNVWAQNGGWNGPKTDLAAPTATTIIDKDLKMPSTWKSSLSVDAVLPGGVKASLEGLYSYGFNEVYATTLGYAKTGTVQLPGEPKARDLWTSEGLKAGGYHAINTDKHGQYYAVTAQVSKEFDFGLSLMAAYTRSGATSVSDGNGDQISEFANIYNTNGVNTPELGYAAYVTPNRLIANVSYTQNWSKFTSTKIGLFYEGTHVGYIAKNGPAGRYSYLMNNVSGAGKAYQLLYIPTDADLKNMPFTSEENKAAYAAFIKDDRYLSSHRGEYAMRNGSTTPWVNRINFHVAQDFNFNVAGKTNTVELGFDVNNVANLLNSNWGVYKNLSTNQVLKYEKGAYTFTAPTWDILYTASSAWSAMFSARLFF